MNDHTRQKHPQCAPRVPGEKRKGGQQYMDGKADSVRTGAASRSQRPKG
jgi:hypothetical protein